MEYVGDNVNASTVKEVEKDRIRSWDNTECMYVIYLSRLSLSLVHTLPWYGTMSIGTLLPSTK